MVILVVAGALALVVGVGAGILASQGFFEAAPSTTTTTLAPITTTTVPQVTTTTVPPSTTTTSLQEPENQAVFDVLEDTLVDSDDPEDVFGAVSVLEIEQDESEIKRALIRFEVVGVPEGESVSSATLQLFQLEDSDMGGSVSFVEGPWDEAETTWLTAPPVGEVIAPLPVDADDGFIDIDVTGAVTGNGTFDFYVTTPFDDSFEFAAKESGRGSSLIVVWGEAGATTDTVLVGAGDIASCDSDGDETTAALITDIAATAEELIVFTTGDNAYELGSLPNFNECYDPSWGQFKDVTRPAAGAREYRTEGAAGYFAYFGSAAGDASEGYYSYDAGGWHIIALNSNCAEVGGCEAGSPQEQWLRQDLEAFASACTLAYWHHPLFSSSPAGGDLGVLDLYDALHEAGAEVVINADNHFYERFEPQTPVGEADSEGIRQFIVGTGGRSLDSIGTPAANSAVRFNEGYGVLALHLFPGGYDWTFVSEPGVVFSDSGEASCH